MKKSYQYRCPWCGEKVLPPLDRHITRRRCEKCGGEYCYHWSVLHILWEGAACIFFAVSICLSLHFLVNDNYFAAVILPLLAIFSSPVFYTAKPIKKYPREIITQFTKLPGSYRVRLSVPRAERRSFEDNAIYPVCFTDGSGDMTSNHICVRLSEVRRDSEGIECTVSELDRGEKLPGNMPENSSLVIFLSDSVHFEGKLM